MAGRPERSGLPALCSDRYVVSNIRPIVWIALYVALVPVFALIYWWLPDSQFRIPDSAGTDFGSWVYYSIVTITTLGFGDYTPAHGWAQAVSFLWCAMESPAPPRPNRKAELPQGEFISPENVK